MPPCPRAEPRSIRASAGTSNPPLNTAVKAPWKDLVLRSVGSSHWLRKSHVASYISDGKTETQRG